MVKMFTRLGFLQDLQCGEDVYKIGVSTGFTVGSSSIQFSISDRWSNIPKLCRSEMDK